MTKSIITTVSLTLVILSLITINLTFAQNENLSPSQISAIEQLNTDLTQSWNTDDICGGQNGYITCDETNSFITKLTLREDNLAGVTEFSNSILSLIYLEEIYLTTKVKPYIQFWNDFLVLSKLITINMDVLYELTPDAGINFPPSLVKILIFKTQVPLPETLFSRSSITSLTIMGASTMGMNIYPQTISGPSPLQKLDCLIYGSDFMDGSNFPYLTTISILMKNLNDPFTYDAFDTFPALEYIYFKMDTTNVLPMKFPSSFKNCPLLKYLEVWGSDTKITFDPDTVLDFTYSPNLYYLYLVSMDFRNLVYPGIIMSQTVLPHILFLNSIVDVQDIDIFQFIDTFAIHSSTVYGTFLEGDYSKLSAVSFNLNQFIDTVLPEEFCEIKTKIGVTGTNINSIPPCFICEWGNPNNVPIYFNDNTNLVVSGQSCNGFNIINNTASGINTNGGKMIIEGNDLGWKVHNNVNQIITNSVLIGNKKLEVNVPAGTGTSKILPVKFHFEANPLASVINLNYDYAPPEISNYTVLAYSSIQINGFNFGPLNVMSLTIAGQPVSLASSTSTISITTTTGQIPYAQNLVASAQVIVDGQPFKTVLRPTGSVSKLTKPYPKLYSGGGFVMFRGEYLTFDTSIMNLSVNGQNFTLINGTADTMTFSYDPLPVGSRNLLFNLDTLSLNDIIQVSDENQCNVMHGYCDGSIPICVDPYTGPDCSSLPGNLTVPILNSTYPTINQNASIKTGEYTSNFTYSFSLGEIREIDTNDVIVNRLNNLPFDFLYDFLYMTPIQSNTSIYMVYFTWIDKKVKQTNLFSQQQTFIPGTMSLQSTMSEYPYQSASNHIEVDFIASLEFTSDIENTCVYTETNTLPWEPILSYHKIKINHIDLFITMNKLVKEGTQNVQSVISWKIISKQSHSIQMLFTFKLPQEYVNQTSEGFPIDFSIYYDEKSARDEIGSFCFGQTEPPQTEKPIIPSTELICRDPTCSSNGQCIKGECICNDDWEGLNCDAKPYVIPPPKQDSEKPTTDSNTPDQVGIHISITSIKELRYNGDLEREVLVSNSWLYKMIEHDEKTTHVYSKDLLENSNSSKAFVTVDYFKSDTQVEFPVGVNSLKKSGSIKYSANITSWNFIKSTNYLQVIFLTSVSDNSESSDSCTFKEINYDQNDSENVKSFNIQVNDKIFVGEFSDIGIVDGENTKIKNLLLSNSNNTDSNTKSNALIGVSIPHFNDFVILDPDFSLLLSYAPADQDKKGSICLKSKKSLSTPQLVGIIIGSVCFVVLVAATTIYVIKKNIEKKRLLSSINFKIANMNK